MSNKDHSIPYRPDTDRCYPSRSCRPTGNLPCRLLHTITCLWAFLIAEDLWEDAADFLSDHLDEPMIIELVPELTAFLDSEYCWKE